MIQYLKSIDRNELTYWLGLSFLFIGLSLRVSVATALCIVGGVIVTTSVASSFFITWLSVEKK